jgi:hypothetical protein
MTELLSKQPVLTPIGWRLLVAFSFQFAVSRVWFRDQPEHREYMADIDRSGFDGMFKSEEDWEMFPRYEAGPIRKTLVDALNDTDDAWVLGVPCSAVYADYRDYFAEGILEASKSEDTFKNAWLHACSAPTTDE